MNKQQFAFIKNDGVNINEYIDILKEYFTTQPHDDVLCDNPLVLNVYAHSDNVFIPQYFSCDEEELNIDLTEEQIFERQRRTMAWIMLHKLFYANKLPAPKSFYPQCCFIEK